MCNQYDSQIPKLTTKLVQELELLGIQLITWEPIKERLEMVNQLVCTPNFHNSLFEAFSCRYRLAVLLNSVICHGHCEDYSSLSGLNYGEFEARSLMHKQNAVVDDMEGSF